MKVDDPVSMNETFARAFNSGRLENLLALYERDAVLLTDAGSEGHAGAAAIANTLASLLQVPGSMRSRNNFCARQGELALLRADWEIVAPDGSLTVSGSSCELIRRQADGSWLYVIDHATGAGLPRVA